MTTRDAAKALGRDGWVLTTDAELGLPPGGAVMRLWSRHLAKDPRDRTKLHARDVVDYRRFGHVTSISERPSIAFTTDTGAVVDDFSRFSLTTQRDLPGAFLDMIPTADRRPEGGVSADYFAYSPGARADLHRDQFGDWVMIWCLGRDGEGGENVLATDGGDEVLRHTLQPGEVLMFSDAQFQHAITELTAGWRHALILISLRPGR